MLCTRLRPDHLSIRVGDSSQHGEEIVKNLKLRLWMRLLLLLLYIYTYQGFPTRIVYLYNDISIDKIYHSGRKHSIDEGVVVCSLLNVPTTFRLYLRDRSSHTCWCWDRSCWVNIWIVQCNWACLTWRKRYRNEIIIVIIITCYLTQHVTSCSPNMLTPGQPILVQARPYNPRRLAG